MLWLIACFRMILVLLVQMHHVMKGKKVQTHQLSVQLRQTVALMQVRMLLLSGLMSMSLNYLPLRLTPLDHTLFTLIKVDTALT